MSSSRQLAAIMFTDIVGYTALMGKDEKKAFEVLRKNRIIQKPLIEKFSGKLLKEMGDGILASFHTITDAVYCAIEIQDRCKKEGGFELRIGMHIGEVVFEKHDVFGNGVNIASRIQSLGSAGEILVSEAVYRNIMNRTDLKIEYLRDESLKNVEDPLKIYRVSRENTVSGMALKKTIHLEKPFIPKRKWIAISFTILAAISMLYLYNNYTKKGSTQIKSIAVLPFKNLSNDISQEYIGDGIAEEILNVLFNSMKELRVSGRSSSFSLKNKGYDLITIGKQLNVKAILEGSFQISDNRIQVNYYLNDAETGKQIWADQIDEDMKDILILQEKIAEKIAEQLKLTLSNQEINPLTRTVNPEAWKMVLKGNYHFNKGFEGLIDAIEYHKKAIEIDSTFAYPYIRLGWALYQMTLSGAYPSFEGFKMAKEQIEKGLQRSPGISERQSAHLALAFINLWGYNWQTAEEEHQKALKINPKVNDFRAFYTTIVLGQTTEGVDLFKKVVEEDPVDVLSLRDLAVLQTMAHNYNDAFHTCNGIIELEKSFSEAYRIKGFIYNAQKKFDSSLIELRKALLLKNPWAVLGEIIALGYSGKKREAFDKYETLKKNYPGMLPSMSKALIHHSLGEIDEAFRWLNKSFDDKDFYLATVMVEPLWDPFRSDPRFQKLIARMNFPK